MSKNKCILPEEVKELLRVLYSILPDLRINYLLSTEVRWVGDLHLNTFIDNLSKLENANLCTYTFLKSNYKEVIDEVKNLIAKLRLQGLPLPSVHISYSTYHDKRQEGVTEHYVNIDKYTSYRYFRNLYISERGCITNSGELEIEKQEKQYLNLVRLVLINVYEVITRDACNHLGEIRKNINT